MLKFGIDFNASIAICFISLGNLSVISMESPPVDMFDFSRRKIFSPLRGTLSNVNPNFFNLFLISKSILIKQVNSLGFFPFLYFSYLSIVFMVCVPSPTIFAGTLFITAITSSFITYNRNSSPSK